MSPGRATQSTVYRACNLCEAICGLEIEVEGDSVKAIRGDRNDPFSRGHICPKAVALQDIHADPARLRRPVRKTSDGSWEEISWQQAFDLAGSKIRAAQRAHGRDSIATYLGNPNVHNYGSLLFGPAFLRTLRTRNRYSATSVDQLPHHLSSFLMFGHQLLLPVPDVDRTDYLLIFGANPLVSNGSMMTAPGIKKRLQGILERGGKIVVIDPRKTETAALASRHHFVRPGSDAWLLAAMVQTIFADGLVTLRGVAEQASKGLAKVEAAVRDFTPERVADSVGLEPAEIRALARELCSADRGVCYGRIGVSVQQFGGTCQWLIQVLNIISGNLDRAGGSMFNQAAVDPVGMGVNRGSIGRWRSRVRDLPEVGGELPVAALAEEIDTPGDGQIKVLLTMAGNPVLSTPNGGRLEAALGRLDFMISIDIYINETTSHADLILPPTSALEHEHYDLVFNLLAVRRVARYSPAVFEPRSDSRHDWQILAELQRRLDRESGWKRRVGARLKSRLGPERLLDIALRRGAYGSKSIHKLTLGKLRESPHGIDFGPLEPCLADRLATTDGLIDLAPDEYLRDCRRLAKALEAESPASPLVLIGRRDVRSNNSWMHKYPRLTKGKDRCTLFVHPRDAERAGLRSGDAARLESRVGTLEVPIEVSDAMMQGVVSLPHGWGHGRQDEGPRAAFAHVGVSLNDLSDEERVDRLSGTAVLNGVPVSLTALPARDVRANSAPRS